MALQIGELSIQLIESLRPLMPRIKSKDKALEDQIRRSASSIALSVGEAEPARAVSHGRGRDAQRAPRRRRLAPGGSQRGQARTAPTAEDCRHALKADARVSSGAAQGATRSKARLFYEGMALKDDPTLLGAILLVTVSVGGFFLVGPLSIVLGAAAFFLPHALRANR